MIKGDKIVLGTWVSCKDGQNTIYVIFFGRAVKTGLVVSLIVEDYISPSGKEPCDFIGRESIGTRDNLLCNISLVIRELSNL